MQLLDTLGEFVEARRGRLDEAEPLLVRLGAALPPIAAGDRADDLHAGRDTRLQEGPGESVGVLARFGVRGHLEVFHGALLTGGRARVDDVPPASLYPAGLPARSGRPAIHRPPGEDGRAHRPPLGVISPVPPLRST